MSDIQDKFLDLRTRERYLKKGKLSKTELQGYLDALPNEEENFNLTTFEEESFSDEEILSEEE